MFELLVLVVLGVVAWFCYTYRLNKVTGLKTGAGLVGHTIKASASLIKAEADIAKTNNAIADVETDRLKRFADRNAQRIVKSMFDDLGLDDELRANQKARLEEAQARLVAAKEKASKK